MDKLTDMVTDCLEYEDKITPEGKLMEKILDRLSSIRDLLNILWIINVLILSLTTMKML